MKKHNSNANANKRKANANKQDANGNTIGIAAAAGGALGVGGAAISSLSAEAGFADKVVSDPEFDSEDVEIVEATAVGDTPGSMHAPYDEPTMDAEEEISPEEEDVSDDEPEVEVLGFDRMATDDGSEVDVAVLRVDGHAAMIMDANQDGEADFIAVDVNDDGIFSAEEQIEVTGQGYSMQPYIAAARHHSQPELPEVSSENDDPLLAEADPQDMPDFINDADVADFDL